MLSSPNTQAFLNQHRIPEWQYVAAYVEASSKRIDAELLRQFLVSRGLSVPQFAESCGISMDAVTDWLAGRSDGSPALLARVICVFPDAQIFRHWRRRKRRTKAELEATRTAEVPPGDAAGGGPR